MTRWKAAGIHAIASIVVAAIVAGVVVGLWFRGPLFHATGAARPLAILIAIALVAGPLLTLIVYRAGKWGMTFDLWFIAIVQLVAFAGAAWVMSNARPVFIVHAVDRFALVTADQLAPEDLAAAPEPFRTPGFRGPLLVAAIAPDDADARNAILMSALGGRDIDKMPRYYRPYAGHAAAVIARAKPLAALRARSSADARAVDAFVAGRGDAARMGYVPLVARRDMAAVVSLDDARFLGAIAVDPW